MMLVCFCFALLCLCSRRAELAARRRCCAILGIYWLLPGVGLGGGIRMPVVRIL